MFLAICDDSRAYINSMEKYLRELNMFSLVYDIFESGEELVDLYQNGKASYDVIFLDMEMKGLDGIQTANQIREFDKKVLIVFVTSHTEYMLKSFECLPFRFLVKPVTQSDIQKVIGEILLKLQEEPQTFIFTERKNRIRLFCDDILFFENQGHWVLVYTKETQYEIYQSFYHLYERLDKNTFCRVHKSFIVNYKYIKEIKEKDICLYDYDQTIPFSRTYKKELINGFLNFKERKYLI